MSQNPEMADWLGHGQTIRLRKAAEKDLRSKLTKLASGCAVSTDPGVRAYLAEYRAAERLLELLTKGDTSGPSDQTRPA